jgi:hypothetical protein
MKKMFDLFFNIFKHSDTKIPSVSTINPIKPILPSAAALARAKANKAKIEVVPSLSFSKKILGFFTRSTLIILSYLKFLINNKIFKIIRYIAKLTSIFYFVTGIIFFGITSYYHFSSIDLIDFIYLQFSSSFDFNHIYLFIQNYFNSIYNQIVKFFIQTNFNLKLGFSRVFKAISDYLNPEITKVSTDINPLVTPKEVI